MWKFLKEYLCIDKEVFHNIIKFWKKYKAFYIASMLIIFLLTLFLTRFYRKEFKNFKNLLNGNLENNIEL